ncbi:hypothetical protein ARMGADRAFT_1092315 [Armillaria gallica]|uniref:Uncharacterized protein n=1 Tax=Armillaria gallica TaxID=47427 RepID=A0A2H3CBA7_ARMGA|nr:hypothetical protein ARMGADRAFT_1092315 [Armillaria gallica]
MAEPPVIKDAATLRHEALSSYKATAALLQHKIDFPPDKDSSAITVDKWLSDAYLQWIICSNFWRPTSIKKNDWNDLEYVLLACLPLVDKGLIDDSHERFNALVHRVSTVLVTPQRTVSQRTPNLAGSIPNLDLLAANPVANTSLSNICTSGSSRIHIAKPPFPRFTALSTAQKTGQPTTSQRKVTPKSPNSSDAFQKDWTSPLHSKPAQQLQIGSSSHTSPTHPTAAYFKAIQSSKPDAKKQRKDMKNKDKTLEVAVPHKCVRTEDEASQTVDKPALKKLKLKDHCFDKVEVIHATPVIRKCGPRLSKPLPVTLGVRGGGFGEKVLSTAKAVRNGIKSIGVLKVNQDFDDFVEIDKSYWSKAVMPFVGERYTTACDHFQCIRCHYSKLPCKVDGVAALNPVKHYRPRGYDTVNTFESALNAIEANNTTVSLITQQYLASLSVVAHTDSIRAQLFHLCGCLAPVKDEEDGEDGKDDDDDGEAPEDVAEGVAGPLMSLQALYAQNSRI